MKGIPVSIEKHTDNQGAYLAPHHELAVIIDILSDLTNALEGVGCELAEQNEILRRAFTGHVNGPAPIYTKAGEKSPQEWFGGSR
jgi:hypothetical protein